jgi:hypothetical protein
MRMAFGRARQRLGGLPLRRPDPDEHDEPAIVVYCPLCAAAEFGYGPGAAENYVCA